MKREFNHILNNHRIVKDDGVFIQTANKAFQQSDFFVEYIRARGDDLWFWKLHWGNIQKALRLMNASLDEDAEDLLKSDLKRLIRSNRAFVYTYFKLVFFRSPTEHGELSTHFSYWVKIFPTVNWLIPDNKLLIDVFSTQRKMNTPISSLDTALSYWPKQQAKVFVNRLKLNNCLILNQDGNICEALDANVFIVKKSKIYTPSLESGCRMDVLRFVLIDILKKMSLEVEESCFSRDILFEAEEVFLVDIRNGVRPVLMYQNKRYYTTLSSQLVQNLINQNNYV